MQKTLGRICAWKSIKNVGCVTGKIMSIIPSVILNQLISTNVDEDGKNLNKPKVKWKLKT